MDSHNKITHVQSSRLAGLDILRVVAVLLVLGSHMWMWSVPSSWPESIASIFEVWKRGGWVGVDLFFVLSGFLVSGLLFAEYRCSGRLAIGRFYVRRGWKIYPPFFFLIGAALIAHVMSNRPIPVQALLSELLFLQSYIIGLLGHTWSLAVEEHFYFLLPILLLAMIRSRGGSQDPFARSLPLMVCVFAAALLAVRLANACWRNSYSHITHLCPTHLRLDSLLFGVLLAYWYHFKTEGFTKIQVKWRWCLLIAGCLLLSPPFIFPLKEYAIIYTIGFTTNYVGAGAVLMFMLSVQVQHNLVLRGLTSIGRNSYSIYLWHFPIVLWGIPQLELIWGCSFSFPVRVSLFLIGSVVVGIAMAYLVEVPALRLRNRWFPSLISASGRSDTLIRT